MDGKIQPFFIPVILQKQTLKILYIPSGMPEECGFQVEGNGDY